MGRELYRAEMLGERVAEISPTGRVKKLVRRFQVLKLPLVDPVSAVLLASAYTFSAMPRFSFFKQPAPFGNMYHKSCIVTEDPGSHGTRVFFEQVFELSSEDGDL